MTNQLGGGVTELAPPAARWRLSQAAVLGHALVAWPRAVWDPAASAPVRAPRWDHPVVTSPVAASAGDMRDRRAPGTHAPGPRRGGGRARGGGVGDHRRGGAADPAGRGGSAARARCGRGGGRSRGDGRLAAVVARPVAARVVSRAAGRAALDHPGRAGCPRGPGPRVGRCRRDRHRGRRAGRGVVGQRPPLPARRPAVGLTCLRLRRPGIGGR